MKIVIIEDEKLAAERLQSIIKTCAPESQIIKITDSVEKSIEWFVENKAYDLVFMDIQLADGISFEIFEKVSIKAPIIFTTAYDEYAIKAFKVNSIDYILKPYDKDDITKALNKLKNLNYGAEKTNIDAALVDKLLSNLEKKHKTRFVVKVGEHIRFIPTDEVCIFYSQEKSTFMLTSVGKSYGLDYALEQIEEMIDPAKFFRISRKYIVSLDSIVDIVAYTNSRLKLKLKQCLEDDAIVSRERVQDFKSWLEG